MDETHAVTPEEDLAFLEFHARNLAEALALRGRRALVVGAGAVGSNVAVLLARAGMDLTLIDRDTIEPANLHRHAAPRSAVGQPKALATARALRDELPAGQRVRGIHGDADLLTDAELSPLVSTAAVVVGATGNAPLDRRLNTACRRHGVPFVVPGLWPGQGPVLGEVLVVPWGQPEARTASACFTCIAPPSPEEHASLDAQGGAAAEILAAAGLTAQLITALLLPDAAPGRWLAGELRRGRNYFLMRRLPIQLVPVATSPRPRCPDCALARPSAEAVPPASSGGRRRNWSRFFVPSEVEVFLIVSLLTIYGVVGALIGVALWIRHLLGVG